MTNDCLDDALDRFLAGRPVPAEAAFLETFANAVHAVASHTGRPNRWLEELLAAGLAAGPDNAVMRVIPVSDSDQPSRQRRRRRTVLGSLAAAAPAFVSARTVAQAATGLSIVIVIASATGAGAAGVLPHPIQGQMSAVLEAVMPFDLPDDAHDGPATDGERATPHGDTGRGAHDGGSPAGTPARAAFGRQVSEGAQRGAADGHVVSGRAHDRNQSDASAGASPGQPATERPTPASSGANQPGTPEAAKSKADPAAPASPTDAGRGRP